MGPVGPWALGLPVRRRRAATRQAQPITARSHVNGALRPALRYNHAIAGRASLVHGLVGGILAGSSVRSRKGGVAHLVIVQLSTYLGVYVLFIGHTLC